MIDLKRLRADPAAFRSSLGDKRFRPGDLERAIELDASLRARRTEVEGLRARQNAASREIPGAQGEARQRLLQEMKDLSVALKEGESRLREGEGELQVVLASLPNPPSPGAPSGGDEANNVVLRQVGEPARFDFAPADHLTLGERRGWIDVGRAARVSGTRFAYLLGELVDLEFALVRLALDHLQGQRFRPVIPPILVRETAMYGTGFFPADRNEIYKLQDEDLYLVGTSEVPLAALHAEETLDRAALPARYAGFSTCLRREAGSYGKDTRGIFRVHQFDKVEMFSFCDPEASEDEHRLLLRLEEGLLQALEIPYRVVDICAGDLGASAARKFDLEAWFPGQDGYREVTSCSNCTDFQARRLGIRVRGEGGNRLVHTLNGTAIAVGRTLIALIENHQRADGAVHVPVALRPYLGGRESI
jgi:seryl-tRNA synthetase